MLSSSKFVNFRKGQKLQSVSTNVQCPSPSLVFEEVTTADEPAPVPARLEEILGPSDPCCLNDIFGEMIYEQRSFSVHLD